MKLNSKFNSKFNYIVIIYGRNEARHIERVFDSLISQSIMPEYIIYVDDASTDNSQEILKEFAEVTDIIQPVYLTHKHASYVGKKELSHIVNVGINAMYRLNLHAHINYFMIGGGDITYEPYYAENVLREFSLNKHLMICSGNVAGEPLKSTFPRGAGRMHDLHFWSIYIREFPFTYIWESYPVYKALALGYHVKQIEDARMIALRPTTEYKNYYGYAMRELGYLHFYALARIVKAYLQNPISGFQLFKSYLARNQKVYDKLIMNYIRNYQLKRMKEYMYYVLKYRLRSETLKGLRKLRLR